MGARIEAREGRFPPFTVHGATLTGIEYELPVASAQVKSCVLLAGLCTEATTVIEPTPSRDHTERMLAAAGAPVSRVSDRCGVSDDRGQHGRARARRTRRARRSVVGGVPDRGGGAGQGARGWCSSASGVNWTRVGLPAHPRAHGGDRARRPRGAGDVPGGRAGRRHRRLWRSDRCDDGRGRGGAARDRRASIGCAARLLRRRRHGGARCRRASGQGVGPDRDGRRGAARSRGARSRRSRTGSW